MANLKAALSFGLYHAAAISAVNEITNPYDGLPDVRYTGSNQSRDKTKLSKKQKKRRDASNRAKRARKRNRN